MTQVLESLKRKVFGQVYFSNRYAFLSPSGSVLRSFPSSVYTPRGRARLRRRVCSRLRKGISGFDRVYMLTLTFSDDFQYRKGVLSSFLNSFFAPFRRRGIPYFYFWVAEFQKRGTIHYHILVYVRSSDFLRYRDFFSHSRIERLWGRGYVWISASSRLGLAFRYATKYLLKQFSGKRGFSFLLQYERWKMMYGSFRLYGMKSFRRFRQGVRKSLIRQYKRLLQIDWSSLLPSGVIYTELWGALSRWRFSRVRAFCEWESPPDEYSLSFSEYSLWDFEELWDF